MHSLIRDGERTLRAAGIDSARREAEWVLGHLLAVRPLELYLREAPIPGAIVQQFQAMIAQRATGMPLQYLLGETEFFGHPITVAPGVFIPRPETEVVVQTALELLRTRQTALRRPLRLLDFGTGSGCIALTLAERLEACVVVGVEVTWGALRIARQNVLRHRLDSRVWLVQGHWGEAVSGGFDGIVSNPPYVSRAQLERVPREVRHEPQVSLAAGEDGLEALGVILAEAPRLLLAGGIIVLECGEQHVETLLEHATALSWVRLADPIADLSGRPRGVAIHRHAE